MLFVTTLIIVRNQRILHAWNTRQEETQRRAAAGLPPKTANGAARPSPASPPGHPDHATATTTSPAPVTTSQDSRHNQAKARPDTRQTRKPGHAAAPENPGSRPRATGRPECQTQT
jgi:hypothetical protein